MPELHKLTPPLGILQDRGFKVALLTDGRMSGASGKVPASIHMTPEALMGGNIAKIRTGDLIRFDSVTGELNVLINEAEWNRPRSRAYRLEREPTRLRPRTLRQLPQHDQQRRNRRHELGGEFA